MHCRTYVECVWRDTRSVVSSCVETHSCETSYYRSSSHTLWIKTPLGANNRSQGMLLETLFVQIRWV
jgi:hypothetical protein